jgi:hypothetical protein
VGEAVILSSLLKTIANELSPDASQKKLLQTYQGLADICQSLVDLSRNLFDIETWQHYRDSGHKSFESYCVEMLGVPAFKNLRIQNAQRSTSAQTEERRIDRTLRVAS